MDQGKRNQDNGPKAEKDQTERATGLGLPSREIPETVSMIKHILYQKHHAIHGVTVTVTVNHKYQSIMVSMSNHKYPNQGVNDQS